MLKKKISESEVKGTAHKLAVSPTPRKTESEEVTKLDFFHEGVSKEQVAELLIRGREGRKAHKTGSADRIIMYPNLEKEKEGFFEIAFKGGNRRGHFPLLPTLF